MGRIEAHLEPARFARTKAVLQHEADAVFKAAHKAGRKESSANYLADALDNLLSGTPVGDHTTGGGTEIVFLVDFEVWRNRHTEPGGTVELMGVGDVPVETVEDTFDDAFIKAVVADGVDVRRLLTCQVVSSSTARSASSFAASSG